MPESKAARRAAAIALHHPEKLYERNKGLLKASQEELHKMASTPEKGLPVKKVGTLRKLRRKRG